jgi:hypothetical protein
MKASIHGKKIYGKIATMLCWKNMSLAIQTSSGETKIHGIRDELLDKGVLIEDKDGKTVWKFK